MSKKVTTLFIRDNSINLLVMKGSYVEKWAKLVLEPGLVSQGLILNEDEVANKIKELFELSRVTLGKVIIGLSGLDSLYRFVTLPELPSTILPEAVRHEAERVLPISPDEVYFSYQHIPSVTTGETRIFLTAFPRNITDALIRTTRQAGLNPYLADLAPLALCRIPNEPRSIIVNTRLDHLVIMIIEDRLPQLIRRLSLPGEIESLSEKLPVIADEFIRTITFYNSNHLEKPLDSTVPVFVCGDLADTPENWQLLTTRMDLSVSPLVAPVESPEGFDQNEYMVNIGLAFKELLPENTEANYSIVNMNILPGVPRRAVIPRTKIVLSTGLAVGIGVLAYMGFLVYSNSSHATELRSQIELTEELITQQAQEIATLSSQIETMEAQIESTEDQIELVEATTSVLNSTLTNLHEERGKANEDLKKIVSLLPNEVNLTEVNHDGSVVTVLGIAPDEYAIFQYSRQLRDSGRFPDVTISSITEYIKNVGGENIILYNFLLELK